MLWLRYRSIAGNVSSTRRLFLRVCFHYHAWVLSRRQRLPAKNVYYYRCPDHRRNYVMSFAFCFDREDDVYQFAYCYPYTYSRLQHYLEGLERRNLDYLQREQLGLSVVSARVFTSPPKTAPRAALHDV